MTIIRVVPSSIHSYVTKTNMTVTHIQAAMRSMMTEARNLNYEGQSAAEFKTDIGLVASDFVTGVNQQLAAMVGAVNRATGSITASLGGTPALVRFTPVSLVGEPVAAGGDRYDVDIDQLSAFKGLLGGHIDEVRSGLLAHRRALDETDWQGNAKQAAAAQVGALTTKATGLCDLAQSGLQARIEHQIQATTSADQAMAFGGSTTLQTQ